MHDPSRTIGVLQVCVSVCLPDEPQQRAARSRRARRRWRVADGVLVAAAAARAGGVAPLRDAAPTRTAPHGTAPAAYRRRSLTDLRQADSPHQK